MNHPQRSRVAALTALCLAWTLGSCSDNDTAPPAGTITTELGALGFNELSSALQSTGLDSVLEQPGPLTVFAPTDDAFSRLPAGAVGAAGSLSTLEQALQMHVLDGQSDAADLRGTFSALSLGGEVVVDEVDGQLFINNARVTRADIPASNGVIHELDEVLLPQRDVLSTLQGRGFSTLIMALQAAQLDTALQGPGSFTVIAPTDAAFAALNPAMLAALLQPQGLAQLTDLLDYHLVRQKLFASQAVAGEFVTARQGSDLQFVSDGAGELTVNDVRVDAFNIPCTNGFIYVVDAVLMPPVTLLEAAQSQGLNTFASLAIMADLGGMTLAGLRRATVLGPTDAAFAALPASATAFLTDPANVAQLREVLNYHVIEGAQSLTQLAAQSPVTTVNGATLQVGSSGFINMNAVSAQDLRIQEGLLHVLEGVLVPPGLILP